MAGPPWISWPRRFRSRIGSGFEPLCRAQEAGNAWSMGRVSFCSTCIEASDVVVVLGELDSLAAAEMRLLTG